MEIDNKVITGLAIAFFGGGGFSLDTIMDQGEETTAAIEAHSATKDAMNEALITMTGQVNFCWEKIPELRAELQACHEGESSE